MNALRPETRTPGAGGPREDPSEQTTPIERLRRHLRRRYLLLLSPPAVLLGGIEAARARSAFDSLPYVDHATWDVVLVVLTALFALALPRFYRSLFVRAHRGRVSVSFAAFYRFENNSMVIALFSVWIYVAASLIAVPAPYRWGIFLMTFLACCISYPAQRKLASHAAEFRIGGS